MVAVAVFAIALLAPAIPSTAAGYARSPEPGTGWGVLVTPLGTYSFYSFGNGTSGMNLTSYEKLLTDPYVSFGSACTNGFDDGLVLLKCPQTSLIGGVLVESFPVLDAIPTLAPAASPSKGFESAAYWLFHQGAVYFHGRYFWG